MSKNTCETCRWWEETWRDDQLGECQHKKLSGWQNEIVDVGDYEHMLVANIFGCIFWEARDE